MDQVQVHHRPRLLSDNGSAYVSSELRDYLGERGMTHTRGAPCHPQTQGKIERYHPTMKNVVKRQHYSADAYFGRRYAVISDRAKIKKRTMRTRKKAYLAAKAA